MEFSSSLCECKFCRTADHIYQQLKSEYTKEYDFASHEKLFKLIASITIRFLIDYTTPDTIQSVLRDYHISLREAFSESTLEKKED